MIMPPLAQCLAGSAVVLSETSTQPSSNQYQKYPWLLLLQLLPVHVVTAVFSAPLTG